MERKTQVVSQRAPNSGILKRLRNLPVFSKLYLTILVVVVVTLGVTGVLVASVTTSQQIAVQSDSLRDVAVTFTRSLDTVLAQDVVGRIEVLSLSRSLRESVEAQNSAPQSLDDITILDTQWRGASDSDALIAGVLNNELADELREFKTAVPNHVEVFATDAAGALIASTNRTSDYYQADEEWWQATWNGGQGAIYIGQPEFDESSNSLALTVAIPIRAQSGASAGSTIGVLRSTYLFTSLVDLFASANDGQRAALHLYLGADIRVGEQTGSSEASAFTLLDADEQAEVAAFPASTSIQTTYENTDNIVYRLNVADVSEYPFIDALGWFVVAHVSTADAFAVIAQSNLVIVISALLGLGFAAVLGFGVSRLIVSPIHQLTELAKKFSAGEMDTRVPETTRDELGVLAHSFNQMADTVTLRERDLNELNRTLEARVQERTAELRKANALAQESVRLKSEFLSTMSHELRTPLNAMLGYTSLMTEGLAGDFDDDTLDMIERIHKNGQRLLLLINEVLDLARIEAGRMEIVSAPFDLHDMAGQWKSQMEVLAQEKGLDFTVTVDDKLPAQIVGDKDRITQIVVNLLSNAFKFTEKGAVDLTITGRTNSWVISVADTGIGIPPHALNYIFDEFRQVDGSSKRMYGGSGLGLAIVRNLCRLLNGKVSVTSEVGLGSVFTVTLPLEVSVAEMPAEMAVE
ncbi:MAG: HAMP domain-containing protein [Chloroflexi bacterium]|nr:HAMP domain-containing protein [Chloroflexota bacterium]MBW7880465.1 HAMP domain-containing protein [Anaerolineae bacterium]MCC6566623.1 HAMP domain-containing protein [Chloroflexota bacterium]MEB2367493.1 ATP-binding protein [Chloroflexota bacterium]OQY85681.1 MAG: hypothetical protein B6D42_02965 [Anaerolineae bacterium UTCFX5]